MPSFWTEDICELFAKTSIFPETTMSRDEKLNTLTRLVIAAAIVMYMMDNEYWLAVLVCGVLVVIFYRFCGAHKNENFTIVPTYIGDDFYGTVVAPTFAEEQRVPPPAYDIYETNAEFIEDSFEEPLRPQAYPYGQYLTRTNLLPSDEYITHINPNGGARSAREYVNSTFMKHDVAYKENMTRLFKKKLNRRFRHNTNDTWSPYHSY